MDLKPCPFCGGKADIGGQLATAGQKQNDDNDGYAYRFVNCVDCLAGTNQLTGDTEQYTAEEAADRWNTRR